MRSKRSSCGGNLHAKFIIFDTKFIILDEKFIIFDNAESIINAEFMILNAEFMILNAEFMILNAEFMIFDRWRLHARGDDPSRDDGTRFIQAYLWPISVLFQAYFRQKMKILMMENEGSSLGNEAHSSVVNII